MIEDGNFSNIGSANSEVKYNTYLGNDLKLKNKIKIDSVEHAIKILENILISKQYGVDKYIEPIEYNSEVYK